MSRSMKDSDEELEPKTGRKTRASIAAFIPESPVRRSSRNKQAIKNDSSPDSCISDSSHTQTTRITRQRSSTMDSHTADLQRNLRSKRNPTDAEPIEIQPKKANIKSIAAVTSVDSPKTIRSRRLTRAGSESKSTPPAANRSIHRTRANSVDPESENQLIERKGKERIQTSTPLKTRRRASVLPSASTVIEETEEKKTFESIIDMDVPQMDENNKNIAFPEIKQNITPKKTPKLLDIKPSGNADNSNDIQLAKELSSPAKGASENFSEYQLVSEINPTTSSENDTSQMHKDSSVNSSIKDAEKANIFEQESKELEPLLEEEIMNSSNKENENDNINNSALEQSKKNSYVESPIATPTKPFKTNESNNIIIDTSLTKSVIDVSKHDSSKDYTNNEDSTQISFKHRKSNDICDVNIKTSNEKNNTSTVTANESISAEENNTLLKQNAEETKNEQLDNVEKTEDKHETKVQEIEEASIETTESNNGKNNLEDEKALNENANVETVSNSFEKNNVDSPMSKTSGSPVFLRVSDDSKESSIKGGEEEEEKESVEQNDSLVKNNASCTASESQQQKLETSFEKQEKTMEISPEKTISSEQKVKVDEKEKDSQNIELADDDSNINEKNFFQDVSAEEWEKEKQKKKEDIDSTATVKTGNETEFELVLVNKEAWLAAEQIKTMKQKETFDYDSDDTVVLKSKMDYLKDRLGQYYETKEKMKPIDEDSAQDSDSNSRTDEAIQTAQVKDTPLKKKRLSKELDVEATNEQGLRKTPASVTKNELKEINDEINKSDSSDVGKKNDSPLLNTSKRRNSLNLSENEVKLSDSNCENKKKYKCLKKSLDAKRRSIVSSSDYENESDNSRNEDQSANTSTKRKNKSYNKNYSTIAQLGSDLDSKEDNTDSDKEDSKFYVSRIPSYLFQESEKNENNDNSDDDDNDEDEAEEKEENKSIDSDIKAEYNLDGKEPKKYEDDDVPGDDCRASESEYSDPDDNGSDLADFVVDDDEVDEEEEEEEGKEESAEEEEGEGKEESAEEEEEEGRKESTEEKEEKEKLAHETENEMMDEDVEDIGKSNINKSNENFRKENKEHRRRQNVNKVENESDTEIKEKTTLNKSLSKVKSRNRNELINEKKRFDETEWIFTVNKSKKANVSLTSSTPKISARKNKYSSNDILDKKEEEKNQAIFERKKNTSSGRNEDTTTMFSINLDKPEEKTDSSKAILSKYAHLNKTFSPVTETPTTKYLKKQKLNDSAPIIQFEDNSRDVQLATDEAVIQETPVNVHPSRKRKRSSVGSMEHAIIATQSKDIEEDENANDETAEVSSEKKKNKKKKNKKKKHTMEKQETNIEEETTVAVSKQKKKKKAKKEDEILTEIMEEVTEEEKYSNIPSFSKFRAEVIETVPNAAKSLKDKKETKEKKKKHTKEKQETNIVEGNQEQTEITIAPLKSKKKHCKKSVEETVPISKEKKKKKVKNEDKILTEIMEAVEEEKSFNIPSSKFRAEVVEQSLKDKKTTKKKTMPRDIEQSKDITKKEKRGIKRLSTEILENLPDTIAPIYKRRKVSKGTRPSCSMFNSNFEVSNAPEVENSNFIPLSSFGGTTKFEVVNLQKSKKQQSKKNMAVASFRQRMLARNSRHPISSYIMFLEKQKATRKN